MVAGELDEELRTYGASAGAEFRELLRDRKDTSQQSD
jgi:hypothetical protein